MFVNSKPYITEQSPFKNNPWDNQKMSYVVGISNEDDSFNQAIDTFALRPGYHQSLNIVPEEVGATERFKQLEREDRKCKLPHENE